MRRDLRAVLPGWVAGRVIVLAALGLAHLLATLYAANRDHMSVFGWDAAWYLDIAERGYDGIPEEGLRFFPLLPLVARAIPLPAEAALLLVANLSALALGLLLHRLARLDADAATAGRVAWLVALTPVSFVLVMPYAEGPATALSVAAFLAWRTGRWWPGAAAGYLVGLLRPTGMLLALPAAIEAWRGKGNGAARLATAVAPVAGCATYLGWSAVAYGDALLPFEVQGLSYLRASPVSNPLQSLFGRASGVEHGSVLNVALRLPWLVVLGALLVVLVRRWPPSYTAFAAASYAAGVTAPNFASLERYAFAGFPFLLAAATVARGRRVQVAAAVVLGGYTVLAFLGLYVP